MQIQPQSIENQLIRQANELRKSHRYFIQPDNPDWIKLVVEAEKLRSVERWAGWAVLGSLYGLIGDLASMNRAFETSLQWRHHQTTISNWISNLVTLGQFTRAQEILRAEAHPTSGFINYLSDVGTLAFAYRLIDEYFTIAETMKMEITSIDRQSVSSISQFLADEGLSDADIARHLDVAGEILSKHRIPVVSKTSCHKLPGVSNAFTVALAVPVSQSEAFDMNIELAMAEEERNIKKNSSFDIVFAAV